MSLKNIATDDVWKWNNRYKNFFFSEAMEWIKLYCEFLNLILVESQSSVTFAIILLL